MDIDITGEPPNSVIKLRPENAAERCQITLLKKKAKDPRVRADLMMRDDDTILLRLEALPKPKEATYA